MTLLAFSWVLLDGCTGGDDSTADSTTAAETHAPSDTE